MSGGKIIPIIAAANRAQSAELKAVINSDIAALINALDDMLMPLEQQLDELRQRVKDLEDAAIHLDSEIQSVRKEQGNLPR